MKDKGKDRPTEEELQEQYRMQSAVDRAMLRKMYDNAPLAEVNRQRVKAGLPLLSKAEYEPTPTAE